MSIGKRMQSKHSHPRHAASFVKQEEQKELQQQAYHQDTIHEKPTDVVDNSGEPASYTNQDTQTTFGSFSNHVEAPLDVMSHYKRNSVDSDRGVLTELVEPSAAYAAQAYKKAPVTRRRFIWGCVGAAAVVAGLAAWLQRKVDVYVNDQKISVRPGATLGDLYKQAGLSVEPGNYIAVDGSVLQNAQGYPYSVSIDDNDLDEKEFANWHVAGGEHVNFANGNNRMEDYDVQIEETQPKLATTGVAWATVRYVAQWGKVGKKEIRTGKESGITADGDVIQEVQNCIIHGQNIKPDNGEKLISVTFDDGPSIYTDRYLKILSDRGIKTTFFNIGQNVDNMKEQPKKVLDEGHYIAGHSYTHPLLSKKKPDQLREELSKVKESLSEATGITTTMFRPPYGDFTTKTWLDSQGIVSSEILWTQDTLDWKQPGVNKIIDGALKNVTPGSVVLMHDGGGKRDQDLEALPQILDKLIANGFKIVSIQELMKSDSSIPSDIADGSATMPDDCVWPTELA
ncbi:polysaccharide deacetylase family protein [Fannyhessea vaginae]|uniref:Tat pathway signal sequence domain protein n=2 Tax=Fannyhessea vaginae TaxID=82135 RepID=F1T4N6_9ACTN|nr:Tat pathway signal sequence domain protein [Fannyhessea vaginae DSM 15829]QPR42006.1 polysaccharide deacetylase family protein [Fannyhessea vaginae]SSZ05154.1 Probable polysaccharide deacetylase pdaA precursor [Fannyhessea vaginae]